MIPIPFALPNGVQASDAVLTPSAGANNDDEDCTSGLSIAEIGLDGTGMFIWKIKETENGDPVAITAEAIAAGISFVIIKIADGTNVYNFDWETNVDLVAPVAQALQNVGIQVWGWHYVYGDAPQAEADIAISRMDELNLDGYVIDAEHHYKDPGKNAAAVQFMASLREGLPDTPVALHAYRFPSLHPIPWVEFLKCVDINMPQMYWMGAQNSVVQLERTLEEFEQLPYHPPVVPIGAAFSEHGWSPTAESISLFREAAFDLELPAVGFWEWSNAKLPSNEYMWATISDIAVGALYDVGGGWLPDNEINDLAYVELGGIPTLIVATDQGITSINGRTKADLYSKPVQDIAVYNDRILYFSEDTQIRKIGLIGSYEVFDFEDVAADITRLEIIDQKLWVGTTQGVQTFSFDASPIEKFSKDQLGFNRINVIEGNDFATWVGGDGGIARIDKDGKIQQLNMVNSLLPSQKVQALVVDGAETLWIGTDRGAVRYDGTNWEIFSPANGLASENVHAIQMDNEGGVWFATDAGAVRYHTRTGAWQRYFRAVNKVMRSDFVKVLLIDKQGTAWLGTELGLVGLYGEKSTVHLYNDANPGSNLVTTLLKDENGLLWIGTYDNGMSLQIPTSSGVTWKVFDKNTSILNDNSVTSLLLDKDGEVWVGTEYGLAICSQDGCRLPDRGHSLIGESISDLAFDSEDSLWVATKQGLFRCGEQCEKVFDTVDVSDIEISDQGNIWVSADAPGIVNCTEEGQCNLLQGNDFPAKKMIPGHGNSLWIIGQGFQLQKCLIMKDDALACEPVLDENQQDIVALDVYRDKAGNATVLDSNENFLTCNWEECLELMNNVAIESQLPGPTYVDLVPGESQEIWIAAGEDGGYYCHLEKDCFKLSLSDGGNIREILPDGFNSAWVVGELNGLYYCESEICNSIPGYYEVVEVINPKPGHPWIQLTQNATLPENGGKLVDTRQVLIEFEGGSLTARSHQLHYNWVVRQGDVDFANGEFLFGDIGAASPGQIVVGSSDEPLEYGEYQVVITIEGVAGAQGSLERHFNIQASPQIEIVSLNGKTIQESIVRMDKATSYPIEVQFYDDDALSDTFELEYQWIANNVSEDGDEWIRIQDVSISQISGPTSSTTKWLASGTIQGFEDDNEASLGFRVSDVDNNASLTNTVSISFVLEQPWWVLVGPYVLGTLSTILLAFVIFARVSGLPMDVFIRQGVDMPYVGVNYRRFRVAWEMLSLGEKTLLLLVPYNDNFDISFLSQELQNKDLPISLEQLERRLESLIQSQFLHRKGSQYQCIDSALLRALRNEIGATGIAELQHQIRSSHSLFIESLEFFDEAGFEAVIMEGSMAFMLKPISPGSWDRFFNNPVFAQVIPDRVLSYKDVLSLQSRVSKIQIADKNHIIVVVNRTPSDSAWSQIGTLRIGRERLRVIPVDDILIQRGREQRDKRKILQSYLRQYLGKQRDLYNVRDPVSDRLNFFGRQPQADELLDALSRKHTIAMLGLRKMGKSSLLLYLRDRISCPVAHVDLQAGIDLGDLYNRIFKSWQRSLRVKLPDFQWEPPALSNNDDPDQISTQFSRVVLDLMSEIENFGVQPDLGLFVDEIEVIVPPEIRNGEEKNTKAVKRYLAFTRAIRGIIQETQQLALMVVGVDPRFNRINRWGTQQNPFYQLFEIVYLGPLSKDASCQMVRNIGRRMGLKYDEEAVEFIVEICGGHPFLMRQLCSKYLRSIGNAFGGTIKKDDIVSAAERFVREPDSESLLNERGLWGEVTNPKLWSHSQIRENQAILVSLATTKLQTEENIIEAGEDIAAREYSIFELKQRSILNHIETMLRIQIGIFRDWILRYRVRKN